MTTKNKHPYGYCPICGAPGVSRERRPDGDDYCSQGHKYPSKDALPEPVDPSDICQFCYTVIYGDSASCDNKKYHIRCYLKGIKFRDQVEHLEGEIRDMEYKVLELRREIKVAEGQISSLQFGIESNKTKIDELCGSPS